MATRVHSAGPSPHTAGIFADMTVDGPEIGTLVVVFDRAKNLPNRKTMGKQNPYCAARLGKEAKKTDTDLRGGQTPRWDQELRFTVHDSPDYENLKISVFSEDKRTDLIGEAWASLSEILKPGGGKADLWQSLNCKGKYAGELRIELTYYDTRPPPEKSESVTGELRQSHGSGSAGKVKRRPLPAPGASGSMTPDMIPDRTIPVRAKHGPRDLHTPARANSLPLEPVPHMQTHAEPHSGVVDQAAAYAQPTVPSGQPAVYGQPYAYGSAPSLPLEQPSPDHHHMRQDSQQMAYHYRDQDAEYPAQPDFLPELPPSNRQRAQAGYPAPQPQYQNAPIPQALPPHMRPHAPGVLHHSHSAPSVPMAEPESYESYSDESHLHTDFPDPIPDLAYQHQQISTNRRRSGQPAQWHDEPIGYVSTQGYDDGMGEDEAPPPPPVHSNSAPVVPHYESPVDTARSAPTTPYGQSPSHGRHQSVPNLSPLQNVERRYGQPQRTPPSNVPVRGRSTDDYTTPSPEQLRPQGSTPPHTFTPSPPGRQPIAARPLPHRLSVGEAYNSSTPSRPHPLSQEVPRPRSPNPQYISELPDTNAQPGARAAFEQRNAMPVPRPNNASPHPSSAPVSGPATAAKPRSTYSIQFPVRAFASSDGNPLSTSTTTPPISNHTTPLRKSVSPRPSPPQNTSPSSSVPFGPDSFDIHNPRAQIQSNSSSYQIRPGHESHPRETASGAGPNSRGGPIVGWHGQEIDPSDHLPVDSWAPEPEKKTPSKTYGLGRERDFGPRNFDSNIAASPGAGNGGTQNLSKDTVVNFRGNNPETSSEPPISARARLQKKFSRSPQQQASAEPLREHHNYNNAAPTHNVYSTSPTAYYPNDASLAGPGGAYGRGVGVSDALAREISSIDIGSTGAISGGGVGVGGRRSLNDGGAGGVNGVAFVPVRSHRDRRSFY